MVLLRWEGSGWGEACGVDCPGDRPRPFPNGSAMGQADWSADRDPSSITHQLCDLGKKTKLSVPSRGKRVQHLPYQLPLRNKCLMAAVQEPRRAALTDRPRLRAPPGTGPSGPTPAAALTGACAERTSRAAAPPDPAPAGR